MTIKEIAEYKKVLEIRMTEVNKNFSITNPEALLAISTAILAIASLENAKND